MDFIHPLNFNPINVENLNIVHLKQYAREIRRISKDFFLEKIFYDLSISFYLMSSIVFNLGVILFVQLKQISLSIFYLYLKLTIF